MFERPVNLWIWFGLCAAFALPFLRGPPRMLHVDVAVLVALAASYLLFTENEIDVWVPLASALLVYLLVRMLALAIRRAHGRGERSHTGAPLAVPVPVLGCAAVVLLGFRLAFALTGNVSDVGYAGVIGADRLLDGEPLYGGFPLDNPHGDTYGPANYLAYVPFVAALGWSGRWDVLPAAQAAAICFDLLCVVLLWLVGRRLRDSDFGVLLVYLWLAFPFTLLACSASTNDALPAAFVLLAIYFVASPARRGAALALGGLTKFAPLALLPLFATYRDGAVGGRRTVLVTVSAFGVVAALAMAPVLLHGQLASFWEQTVAFQDRRLAPLSVWSLYGWDTAQVIVQSAVVVLGLCVAVRPRKRDVIVLAALGAAVMIALQLAVTHWFYLYTLWFLPLLLIALLAPRRLIAEPDRIDIESALQAPSRQVRVPVIEHRG